MKLFDLIKEKIAKLPLIGKHSTKLLGFFSNANGARNNNYYTGWVYLAVSTIAQEVAGIKLKLYKVDDKGNKEQVFDHPALELLHKANNFMTQYDVFERLQSNQELHGNEFWYISFIRNTPVAIYPLSPLHIKPVPDQYDYVKSYIYEVDGEKIQIPFKNILQFKQFNPKSDIVGVSTLEAARYAADTDTAAKFYNLKYFENDARPDVILEYPETLSPEQEKRLLNLWNQSHSGPNKQFKTAVASGGLKINSFQISQRDMEYLQGRMFSRDEIMAIFRVPLAVVGLTGNETYASAKAATYAFGARTIKPKMTRIINVLNEFYLSLFEGTENMEFEFESPILEDRDLTLKGYESGLKNGWLSINDVRRYENLPEIEGGEPVMVPFNVQPLGEPIAKHVEVTAGPISKMVSEIVSKVFSGVKAKEVKKKDDTITDSHFEGMTKDEIETFERKGEMIYKARNNRGLEYEKRFKSILDKLWDGQKERAIKNLEQALKSKQWKVKAPKALDEDLETEITIDLLTPLMEDVTHAEGLSALEFLGIFGDELIILTPQLKEKILQNTNKLAGEMTDVTAKKIRAEIAAGLEAGEAIDDLKKRILDSTAFSAARAENIARTETIRAQGRAELEVWKETGVVEGKVWYTAVDERVCPFCDEMNGKTIGLSDDFFTKGDIQEVNGQTLKLDYENVESPPLHSQCRCILIPEIIT